jgi:recombination protein RecA
VKVAKNKCAPPFTEAEFEIRWGFGIDRVSELIDQGLARGVLEKNGNYLAFGGTSLGNGRERTRETLSSDPALRDGLNKAILAAVALRPAVAA